MRFVISCNVSHVLIGKTFGDASHGWVLTFAGLIGFEGIHDIATALSRNQGNFVNLRKTGLISNNAMAANAHRDLVFAVGCIANQVIGMRRVK